MSNGQQSCRKNSRVVSPQLEVWHEMYIIAFWTPVTPFVWRILAEQPGDEEARLTYRIWYFNLWVR
jgi:hypothetical protein